MAAKTLPYSPFEKHPWNQIQYQGAGGGEFPAFSYPEEISRETVRNAINSLNLKPRLLLYYPHFEPDRAQGLQAWRERNDLRDIPLSQFQKDSAVRSREGK